MQPILPFRRAGRDRQASKGQCDPRNSLSGRRRFGGPVKSGQEHLHRQLLPGAPARPEDRSHFRVDGDLPDLSPDQAIAQLRAELMRVTRASLPPAAGSLESWLKVALEAVPAGEVLNAAMTIARRAKP